MGPAIVELFERADAGESTRDLAKWFSARTGRNWSRQGITHILRREIYTGVRDFGKHASGKHARLQDGKPAELGPDGKPADPSASGVVRLAGVAPQMVSPELFARVQQRLNHPPTDGRKKGVVPWALAGLARCGVCGGTLHSRHQPNLPYLICKNASEYGTCTQHRCLRAPEIIGRVLALLAERLLDGDAVARLVELAGQAEDDARQQWEASVNAAESTLARVDARLTTARRRLSNAADDLLEDYERVVRDLKAERAAVEAELTRLRGEQPLAPEEGDAALLTRWLERCRDACSRPREAYTTGMNALMRELVDHVIIWPASLAGYGRPTVGRIEVSLPPWLSNVLALMAGHGGQHAKSIRLVGEG